MAMLRIPNITLGILVWKIDPPPNTPTNQIKPYTALAPIQPVVPTPAFALVPKQPQ